MFLSQWKLGPRFGDNFDAYTVIQNFGFSLPKHYVLKNLPKLPIIQLKFRVKSTKHSSQFQDTRSFVFGKIYKFNTKLRDFHRNISGIDQWVTYHLSSTFFRSNQLAAWSVGLRCWLWTQKVLGSSPKQARKEEQKIKVLPGDQKSESNFSRNQSLINNQNLGPEFSAWFWETETSGFAKNIRNHARSFGWAEPGEILEVSSEKKLLCRCRV
jgi:hypothetical protein